MSNKVMQWMSEGRMVCKVTPPFKYRPLAFYANKRRAARLQRTPKWANLAAIEEVFAESDRISEATGIRHHVDQIVPLQGRTVSGLHVENNLQILTETENCRKGNWHE